MAGYELWEVIHSHFSTLVTCRWKWGWLEKETLLEATKGCWMFFCLGRSKKTRLSSCVQSLRPLLLILMCFVLQPCNSELLVTIFFSSLDLLTSPLECGSLLGSTGGKGRTSQSHSWRCGFAFTLLVLDPWNAHGGAHPTHPWLAGSLHATSSELRQVLHAPSTHYVLGNWTQGVVPDGATCRVQDRQCVLLLALAEPELSSEVTFNLELAIWCFQWFQALKPSPFPEVVVLPWRVFSQHNTGVVGWTGEKPLGAALGLPNSPQICKTAFNFECKIFMVAFS